MYLLKGSNGSTNSGNQKDYLKFKTIVTSKQGIIKESTKENRPSFH